MKRRSFCLLAGTSLATIKLGQQEALAAVDPSLLSTTLTPLGAERAGNADGSIPAWTGGYTTVPAGWKSGESMPDFFADEQPVLVIDSSNMAQHAAKLSDGVMALMANYGYSIKVYPTHRTASAPQGVYDFTAKNAVSASLVPGGGRLGFQNAYGGIPFPIPDTSDPLAAGAQIMWNHSVRWCGYASHFIYYAYASNGGAITLAAVYDDHKTFPYYDPKASAGSYNGLINKENATLIGPSNLVGQNYMSWQSSNPVQQANINWEVLNGQGRVRKAPEVSFDTPVSTQDGITNYDETDGFNGSLEKYDWKFLEKKELYIPYNNNGTYLLTADQVIGPKFANPDVVRWELHRVWVVEATLHPGERHTIPRRRFYFDEDTWAIGVTDSWDGNNSLYKTISLLNVVRPDLPGVVLTTTLVNNLQTGSWIAPTLPLNEKAHPTIQFFASLPNSDFDPQNMAADSQY